MVNISEESNQLLLSRHFMEFNSLDLKYWISITFSEAIFTPLISSKQ